MSDTMLSTGETKVIMLEFLSSVCSLCSGDTMIAIQNDVVV